MYRAFPVLVAILLILCSPAVAFEAGVPSSAATTPSVNNPSRPPGFNNTSAHLSLGTPDRSDTQTPSLSLSATLEMDKNELQIRNRRYTLDEELANAETGAEKSQVLLHYHYELNSELSSLQNKEREISKKFNGQDLTTQEYITQLSVLDSKARNIEDSISYMKAKGSNVPRFSANDWKLRAKLIPITGRVRQYITAEIRGEKTPQPVYVATTKSGVVLSAISGTQYVREAYRSDYRNTSKSEINQITFAQAKNLTEQQYPWVAKHREKESIEPRYGNGIWENTFVYPEGVVKPYLDGGTKKIYREIQYKYLTGDKHIPYGTPVRNNSTNLTLVVNRTYSGGPLRINLTDANGDPVNGRIELGDTSLGKTEEGTLFTVSPSRKFTVTATHDGETVKVTLTPYGVTNETEGSTPRGASESS